MQKIFKRMKRLSIGSWCWTICLFHIVAFLSISQEITKNNNKIRTVVIDAGHGGKDSGALGKNSKEKDIVLAISLKAGKYIEEKIPDVKVVYTRTTDVFIPLHERAKIANEVEADLFISIHANSNPNHHPYGTETFAMGLHKTESNLEVAKKENSVIVFEEDYEAKYEGFDPNDIESYIMMTIMQDIYLEQSLTAASFVQNQFRDRAKRKDRGVKQAGFLVLWQTSMPSILIETGFVSNSAEEKYLISPEGQDYLASAIYRAFKDYKKYIEGESPNVPFRAEAETATTPEQAVIEYNTNNTPTENIAAPIDISVAPSQKKLKSVNAGSEVQNGSIAYKVQILYSEKQLDLDSEVFKDFNDVEEINTNGKYKYVVGSNSSYQEAIEFSKWVKSRHPDAFVVAVSNGKIIPISEALKVVNSN